MKNIIKIIFIICVATLYISIKDNYNYLFQTNLLNNNVEQSITKNTKYNPSNKRTPNFKFFNNIKISNQYYYSYNSDVPKSIRSTFNKAIRKYNDTGILHFTYSKKTRNKNHITFFVYRKSVNMNNRFVELGNGGPRLYTGPFSNHNYGQAGINYEYPNKSVNTSVAIHEIGHALGLKHSKNKNSIMYPVNQGRNNLSKADINALKYIYD